MEWIGWMIGGVTLIVATGALVKAFQAVTLAREANAIAAANEQRQTELSDFDWTWRWVEPGILELRNDGESRAFEVSVTVTVDASARVREKVPVLEASNPLRIAVPGAKDLLDADLRAASQRGGTEFAQFLQPTYHGVWVRVLWRTAGGSYKDRELSNTLDTLEPD